MTYTTLDKELMDAFRKRNMALATYSVVPGENGWFTWTIVAKHQEHKDGS